jgi:hypothetical protein
MLGDRESYYEGNAALYRANLEHSADALITVDASANRRSCPFCRACRVFGNQIRTLLAYGSDSF